MGFLNFSMSRCSYNDATPVSNPQQKNFEFTTSKSGLGVNFPSAYTKVVSPGQTMLLESTARTLGGNLTTTQMAFSRPQSFSDVIRMRYTGVGTAPGFRASRAPGHDATTVVDITRVSNTAKKIESVGGTAFGFIAGGVIVGDEFFLQATDDTFTSPFEGAGQGKRFPIVDLTATSITVRDNGELAEQAGIVVGADFADALRVFGASGAQPGDKIKFNQASAFKSDNKVNVLEVVEATDRDLYVVNPLALDETTVAGVSVPFTIYERLISFIAVDANGPIKLKLNGTDTIELAEFESGAVFFAGSVSATSVDAVNETGSAITISVQTCSF